MAEKNFKNLKSELDSIKPDGKLNPNYLWKLKKRL